MFHDLDHPSLGPVRVLAPPLALDSDGFQPAPATAAFGSEARAILGELGFAAEETEAFIASGVTPHGTGALKSPGPQRTIVSGIAAFVRLYVLCLGERCTLAA